MIFNNSISSMAEDMFDYRSCIVFLFIIMLLIFLCLFYLIHLGFSSSTFLILHLRVKLDLVNKFDLLE